MNEVLKAMKERRSIRAFQPTMPPKADLEKIIEAGLYAASGMGRQSSIIDYTYANYDIAAVEADYEKAADELSRAQLALDAVNQRETFEFEE